MLKLIVTLRNGETRSLDAAVGVSAMETIRDAGIHEIVALCGGACSCATCHVHVDPEFAAALPPMSEDENELLAGSEARDERSRLSCQIRMNDELAGLRVTIAREE